MKKKSSFIKNVKKTWIYIKDAKANLFGYAGISILEAIIGAVYPLLSAKIILNITDVLMTQLLLSALAVFGLDLLLNIVHFFKAFFYRRIYAKTLINLQSSVARETLKLEISEIDKESSGLFIDRLNRDTTEISSLFMEYSYYVSYVITNMGVLVAIYILNKYFFIYSLAVSIIIFFVNKKRLNKQYEVQKELKKLQEKKTGLTTELVRGIRDIKVLNASDTILNETKKKIVETSNKEMKISQIRSFYGYIEDNVRDVTDLIFIILGIYLYKHNMLVIPTFVIIYNYQNKVKNLLLGVVNLVEFNKKFVVSADRIYEIIDNERFKKETFGNVHKDKLEGHIKFDKVSFGYDKKHKVIDNMSFTIKPNERVAFVGKSGAGKTTIFSLITRMYKYTSGKILLDNINIEDLDKSSLRDNMSIITQNPYIFNFTIKENLLLAKSDATMKEIREACKMACIDDFIMSLPHKYNTVLGENGVILSGGQKQRIAIARALLMKTEIILFDEATSALDNETQREIQKAINNLKGEYTTLIVAHRLSTIIDSDKIFVVDKGKIISSGTHTELLKKCKEYKELYESEILE